MKINYQILSIVLLICIGFLLINKGSNVDSSEAVLANIHSRTSVRSYTDEPVSDEIIEVLLKAGMAAPTAGNMQPWEFIVVKDRERLAKLGQMHEFSAPAGDAAAAIVVLADMNTYKDRESFAPFWLNDTSIATENILLAANALGLGAVWLSVYPWEDRPHQVREIVGVKEDREILCVVVLGYPDSENTPKDKWKPEKVTWIK